MALPMAFFSRPVLPYVDAKLGLLTHALNYGNRGVRGHPRLLQPGRGKLYVVSSATTVRRLHESARLLRMNLALSEEATAAAPARSAAAEGLRRIAYIRALAFYTDEVIGVRLHGFIRFWRGGPCPSPYIDKAEGWRTVPSRPGAGRTNTWFRRAGRSQAATINSALAKSDAELAGFDEAIRLNRDGAVSEGSGETSSSSAAGTPSRLLSTQTSWKASPPVPHHLLRDELGAWPRERPVERGELIWPTRSS